jgi:regulator of protease activity HflC (stomatin/prohibitin superfamily)
MSIKNTAVSAVLGLMFLSLLIIYLITVPSPLITFLSVLIMLVALIMAQSNNWRDIFILAAISVIMSMVAIALVASARLGTIGTLIVLLLWGLLLSTLFSSARRAIVPLPPDRAHLIRNTFTGQVRLSKGSVVEPTIPVMERVVAVIPQYELSSDIRVEKINTQRQNVDAVDILIRYKVKDPYSTLAGIPNLGQALDIVAKEMNQNLEEARLRVTFWEHVLNRQMKIDTDDVVLEVIFDNGFAQNPIEVFSKRQDLEQTVIDRLRRMVSRWGVELIDLRFERVEFNPEVAKAINKPRTREEETLDRKTEAERDATRIRYVLGAEVELEAERVRAIISALRDSGVEITPDLIVKAITATSDWQMEGDFSLLTQHPLPPVAPVPAKPAEKK